MRPEDDIETLNEIIIDISRAERVKSYKSLKTLARQKGSEERAKHYRRVAVIAGLAKQVNSRNGRQPGLKWNRKEVCQLRSLSTDRIRQILHR